MGTRKGSSSIGTGCGVLFLMPFAAVGIGAAMMMAWHVWSYWVAQSWIERPCDIVRVEAVRGGKGGSWRVDADYRYEFNNQPFTGNRVWFGSGSDNIGRFQQQVLDELNTHRLQRRPFRCFVNPNDPSASVLYRDIRFEMLAFEFIFVLVFGGVGVGGLFGLIYVIRKTRRMNDARELRPTEPWTWDEATLAGAFRPFPRWIGVVIFAVFWNILTWTILTPVLMGVFQQGPSLEWLAIAFPVVGLVAAWRAILAVHQRLRFGVPPLTVRPWPLFVGQPIEATIDFLVERPASPELVFELTVIRKSTGEGDSDTILYRETVTIPNIDTGSSAHFESSANLPRTALLNDETTELKATWQIKVTGSEGSSDFKAKYELTIFQRSQAAVKTGPAPLVP